MRTHLRIARPGVPQLDADALAFARRFLDDVRIAAIGRPDTERTLGVIGGALHEALHADGALREIGWIALHHHVAQLVAQPGPDGTELHRLAQFLAENRDLARPRRLAYIVA